jgi:Tfp pilus assembly protein PilX
MRPRLIQRKELQQAIYQRGVVLFFALIALVVMSLAAVALIRSVDTSTMIAGNLAFKQSATSSGDAGVEAAIRWLAATEAANNTKNIYTDATHEFNITNASNGYYSNADTALGLFANSTWNAIAAAPITDPSGNKIWYVIQRMCRTANQVLSTTNCLFSSAAVNSNNQTTPLYSTVCSGPGCPVAGQSPEYRITSKITGPKNTVSYIQAFIY